jgi:diaminohydroxyphosphoribosylaminopyrimidine deaminase/5-amino-6-(5-phosphoribosylamino)uracil reductase
MPPGDTGQSDIVSAMQQLGSRGLTRILVEGGNHVASSLFAADLIDQLVWFRAPKILGNGALSAIGNLNIDKLSEMPIFVRQLSTNIGKDFLEILSRSR